MNAMQRRLMADTRSLSIHLPIRGRTIRQATVDSLSTQASVHRPYSTESKKDIFMKHLFNQPWMVKQSNSGQMPERIQALLKDYPLIINLPVQWGEQDTFGHLNNVSYLRYFETAHMSYFASLGEYMSERDFFDLWQARGVGIIAKVQDCKYKQVIEFPDNVYIGARIIDIAEDRVTMDCQLVSSKTQSMAAQSKRELDQPTCFTGYMLIIMRATVVSLLALAAAPALALRPQELHQRDVATATQSLLKPTDTGHPPPMTPSPTMTPTQPSSAMDGPSTTTRYTTTATPPASSKPVPTSESPAHQKPATTTSQAAAPVRPTNGPSHIRPPAPVKKPTSGRHRSSAGYRDRHYAHGNSGHYRDSAYDDSDYAADRVDPFEYGAESELVTDMGGPNGEFGFGVGGFSF
ncbi:hypothetical protein BJ085DRAFT_38450 [Dimargaris cristalligena]|uniref:HotDog domain-containing protein n=1 Tax=Dimargaris cristalligena TaxID=215637 RepID=A0A4P9ZV47_9FUNG|nr:hypothetical protein BJ085DRAFT_38450 [Dimargaris cristalligena]|eukprot:RKP37447.1 hypothetical protein BJ085DRAFT_38450 [Dimargaris cristalligena]